MEDSVRLRLTVPCLSVIVVTLPAFALASPAKTFRFEAPLRGGSEVPKGAPKGSGTVKLTMTGAEVCWVFSKLKGIDKPVAAHIHKGRAGVSGPVVVPLDAKFKASGCIFPSPATVKAIEADPKGFYVNVHSKRYPNGAIRGQLRPGG
jgi:hypothetical protein